MIRAVAWPVTLLTTAMIALAADESRQSKSEEPDAFDIEPPILKQNLSDEPLPAGGTPDAKVARVENRRARKSGSGTTFVEGGAVRVRSRQRASCARKRGSRRPASEADSWRKYQGRPGRCERNPGAIN